MPRPLGKVRLMMSARLLLDLEEADAIFKRDPAEYVDYMRARGKYQEAYDASVSGRKLNKGPLFDLAQTALALNKDPENPLVEICLVCKDTGETALPIFRSIDVHGLGKIEMRYALSGHGIEKSHHDAFGTDLLLTRNPADAKAAVDLGIAAAAVNFPPDGRVYELTGCHQLRLCFDGDAVTFGSSAERYYRENTIEKYKKYEDVNFDKHIEPGPFTSLMAKMSEINRGFPAGQEPFELSLLTARGGPAAARVFTIAEHFNIEFNGHCIFLGGAGKKDPLLHLKWHMFFDDQQTHLEHAMHHCATGLVPYATGSEMDTHLKKKAQKEARATAKAFKAAANTNAAPAANENVAPAIKPAENSHQNKNNPAKK